MFYFFFLFSLQIDENVQREIINHRSLRHPNIIQFKEVSAASLLLNDDVRKKEKKRKKPTLFFPR